MTTEEQDERRKAAVQAFEQREAEAARAKRIGTLPRRTGPRHLHKKMRNGKRKLRSSTWRDGLKQWLFAAGIKILIAPRPREGANFVTYDIQEGGAPTNVAASVTFYMRKAGCARTPMRMGAPYQLSRLIMSAKLGNECRR